MIKDSILQEALIILNTFTSKQSVKICVANTDSTVTRNRQIHYYD